jgi:hypothetical protein
VVYLRDMVPDGRLARLPPQNRAGTMKHIPFAAIPMADRIAVAEAVRRSGAARRHVCVSQLQLTELAGDSAAPCVTLVTARGWHGSYPEESGWLGRLEADLETLRT